MIAGWVCVISCTEKEYIIEEPEISENNSPPGVFEIQVDRITDNEISFNWNIPDDPEGDEIKFDICLNDSVILYDLRANSCSIENLQPDTEYKISVMALDKHRNSSVASKTVQTPKSFLKNIIDLKQEYEDVIIHSVIQTEDGGIFVLARGRVLTSQLQDYEYFSLRLTRTYSLVWKRRYDWARNAGIMAPVKINKCGNGGIVLAQYGAVTKLNDQGFVEWSYFVNKDYDVRFFKSVVQTVTGEYLAAGCTGSGKYIIIKLNPQGEEVWANTYENPNGLFPEGIMIRENNQFMVWGGSALGESLLFMNGEGNLTDEKFFNGNGGLMYCAETESKKYLFFGYNDAYSVRITNVDHSGNLIWNIYPELRTPTGYSGYISGWDNISENEYLVMAVDDRGVSFSILDINGGQISGIIKLSGYPNGAFVRYDANGYYEYISESGYLFRFNISGYREE
jgi:hypothetical protein